MIEDQYYSVNIYFLVVFDIDLDVKCGSAIRNPIYDFLLMFKSNIGPD